MREAPAASQFCRGKLLEVARSLPADLHILSQLGQLLQDVNSELDDVAALLRRDVALATRIVRISNSSMFPGGGGIASTEEAVSRVGFREILKLVGTAVAARMAEQVVKNYGIGADALRDNMLFGALSAEALARAAGMDSRVAYMAGLLRTLGLMVLDRACGGEVDSARTYDAERWTNYAAWEGSIFGVVHCEVAALILDEWRFPAELGSAVRLHYLIRPGDYEHPLAVLLNVANGLALRVNRSFPGEMCWWEITPAKLQILGLTEDDLEPAAAEAEIAFDAARDALRA